MLAIELIKLYFSLAIVFIVPGYFLGRFLLSGSWRKISAFEKIALVGALSITSINFGMIALDKLSFEITKISLLVFIFAFCLLFYFLQRSKKISVQKSEQSAEDKKPENLECVSYRQYLFFFVILILALAIRSFYVSKGIFPQTTDLGHHMYWSKYISQSGNLPVYGMPDFIIGEHLVFSAVQILSGFSYISSFPVIIILLVNVLSLFAVFVLAYETSTLFTDRKTAKSIAFISFFVIGVFYSISDPQAKFISGGVIGNIFGNFFLPLSFYLFIKTIKTKNPAFSSLFILSFATLIYTHHLSSFIFLYSFAGFLILLAIFLLFAIVKPLEIAKIVKENARPFFSLQTVFFAIVFLAFLFIVSPPSYLNTEAIDTAVGAPSKETRVGLPLSSIIQSTGPWRFLYGFFGLVFLGFLAIKSFLKKRGRASHYPLFLASLALLIGWGTMLFLMSFKPALLKVDIPSNRIVSYITFPFTILSAIGTAYILIFAKKRLPSFLFLNVFVFVFGVGIISGLSDVSESDRSASGANDFEARQAYAAAEYLAKVVDNDEMVLKDHIYLTGDTWMKLFFMRDYRFPLSRSYLRRYEDVAKDRETCTRDMVAIPESEVGRQCYSEYNVKYIVLKKGYDTAQFEKSKNFDRIYFSDSVVIFHKVNSN